MSCSFTLQLLGVRGLPSDVSGVVLEVIVRTPRLLSTVRRKYASELFAGHAARGVTLCWTQAKTAKAYVRLRLLPGNAPVEVATAAAPASTNPSITTTKPAADSSVSATQSQFRAIPNAAATATTTATAAAAAAAAAAGASLEAGGNRCVRKSAESLLQLEVPHVAGSSTAMAASPTAPPVQQLSLAIEVEAGAAGDRTGDGGGGSAVPGTIELDVLVLTGPSAAGAAELGLSGASPPAASSAGGPPQAWVAASPPALTAVAPEPVMQPAAPRKRSWLLALGLGRGGGSDVGGGGGGAVASSVDAVVPVGGAGASALGEASSQATSGWNPVAALSSSATTTTITAATAVTATTVATVSSSSLLGPGSADPAAQHRLQGPGVESVPWPTPPATLPGRRRLPPATPDGGTAGLSPFAPLSLAATSEGLREAPPAGTAVGAAATGCTASPLLATVPSGAEPQPPKRRRLGEFFSRLFNASSFGHQAARRAAGCEASWPSAGAAGGGAAAAAAAAAAASGGASPAPPTAAPSRMGSGDSYAAAAAAAAGPAATRPSPIRRHGSPLGLTPLMPPEPRLGDVYRVQDNALPSDVGVQLGVGKISIAAAAAAAATAGELRHTSGLVPGLESPGCGDLSPPGGPDRLRIEPPVNDMAAASLASPLEMSPVSPPGGCFFWRYGAAARARAAAAAPEPAAMASGATVGRAGSAPVPGAPSAAAVGALGPTAGGGGGGIGVDGGGRQLTTLSAAAGVLPSASSTSEARGSHESDVRDPGHGAQHQQLPQGSCQGQVQGQVQGEAAAAAGAAGAAGPSAHPLEMEISRVMEFVGGQTGVEEELRATALSQCQFLMDCIRSPDMCWLVGDSLLQLKREVGFPFDTGVPIPGAPGWFRLVLQPLSTRQSLAAAAAAAAAAGFASAEPSLAVMAPPAPAPEVLKVRWACIDQRQIGGSNACAAICLEVAAWCLGAVQRWRQAAGSAAPTMASTGSFGGGGRRDSAIWPQPESLTTGGGGGGRRREAALALSRSRERERLTLTSSYVEMEVMSGGALEQCIRRGTEVWQGVLVLSPAARVASSTGDFDLEHMLQLGGYSHRLRLADYYAASLLEDGGGGGGGPPPPRECTCEDAAVGATAAAAAVETVAAPPPSLMYPTAPERPPGTEPAGGQPGPRRLPALWLPPSVELTSPLALHPCGSCHAQQQQPYSSRLRHGSQSDFPTFATLVRTLSQGVYVLGWRGHFATLWLRPGGVVHLIDSLGARLAPDCPLAFVLEFDAPSEFLAFFVARHQAQREATAADDIAAANMAALIEVHRLELLQPPAPHL